MNKLKTITYSNYFWIIIICLYLLMLFIIHPDDMDIKNQFWSYLVSLVALHWTRAFMLNKKILLGVGHVDPEKYLTLRCLWFMVCILFLIAYPLHLMNP